jgi:chemotaxis protein methyltransferase CheR
VAVPERLMPDMNLQNFFENVFEKSGYDFRNYSQASLERRLALFQARTRVDNLAELEKRLFSEVGLLKQFVDNMTVQVTEMFRDPLFYRALRDKAVDFLKTYPRVKIWHAGCSNGAEVYSMAILLKEAGLLERTHIYATDINETSLKQAYDGVFALKDMQLYTKNYHQSGGLGSFADYYHSDNQSALFDRDLKKHMTFSFHNLATDSVFTETHMVVCRNVLIYFNRALQDRALKLFDESLGRRGILALGSKETLRFSDIGGRYDVLDRDHRLFQKRGE